MNLVETLSIESGQPLGVAFRGKEREEFRPRKTILLAEDDSDLRLVMEWTLTTLGYLAVVRSDAYEASAAFRSLPAIDLLLTDFEMPGRTGVELALELTALRPTLPVILITGSLLPVETLRDLHDRRWTYMSKPFHLSTLESTLKAIFRADGHEAARATVA